MKFAVEVRIGAEVRLADIKMIPVGILPVENLLERSGHAGGLPDPDSVGITAQGLSGRVQHDGQVDPATGLDTQ